MRWSIRLTLGLLLQLGTALIGSGAFADQYPAKPVRIVVPFAPGGGADTLARIVEPELRDELKQPIVIENRAGAGTIIGTSSVARADPDGYTLLLTLDQSMTMNPFLYDKLSYDPERDFTPVSILATGPRVYVVSSQGPIKSLGDLLERAKAQPNKLSYGSGAISGRVIGDHIKEVTGAEMVFVPYAGGAPALTGLLRDDVQFVVADIGTFAPAILDGRLLGLANSGPKRSPLLPDVPTLRELGYAPLESVAWWAMYAPANTPKPIIDRLNVALTKVMSKPDIQRRIAITGNEATTSSPADVLTWLKRDAAIWGAVIKKGGIRAN